MKTRTNYEGIKVGKLTVLKKVPAPPHIKIKGSTYYLCLCECGKKITIGSGNITTYISHAESGIGRPHSCGCGRMITETGMKIGKLTLLEKVLIHTDNLPRRKGSNGAKKRRNKVHYNCRCECGNTKLIQADLLIKNLRHKTDKNIPISCGCIRKHDINDIIGKKLGDTTICSIYKSGKFSAYSVYECRCKCGRMFTRGRTALLDYIKKDKTTRCDHCTYNMEIFKIGDTIGKLTVLDILNKKKSKFKYDIYDYKCRCECGNEIIRSKKQLVTRATEKYEKSCGCEITRQRLSNVKRYNGIPIKYLTSIKDGAKNRELEYSVSDEYVSNLYHKQNKKCALTGKNISFYCDSKNGKTNASLDRINNDKGYIEGNLQWVDTNINMLKLSWGVDEFKRMCDEVSKFNSANGTSSKKGVKKQNIKIKSDDNMFFQF